MKKTKLLTGLLMAVALIFSSCSKEEDSAIMDDEKAYLSFQTQINDLTQKQQNKQANLDIPECTVGTPAFVEIILTNGDVFVAGSENTPLRLDLNPNAPDTNGDGAPDYFTEESATLELNPGTYTLQYFTVLDADGNVLWIAPMDDNSPGGIDDMVEQSLPMDINLGAGVKKYQNVEVVCFDDRIVNQYGYLFYDLNGIQLIEFCIFGNFCDETGRHAEYVSFSLDVWKYSDNPLDPKGEMLYNDEENAIVVTDYEDYADTAAVPLCVTLPDGPGMDEYYLEITLLYPGEEGTLIRSGLISDADVRSLFNGEDEVEYYHFREGNCNLEDSPVLLGDPQEVTDFVWDFTFLHDDVVWNADVTFYSDGTAFYTEPAAPGEFDFTGYWSLIDNWLYYDMRGDGAPQGYLLTGELVDGKMSGTYTFPGGDKNWTAERK